MNCNPDLVRRGWIALALLAGAALTVPLLGASPSTTRATTLRQLYGIEPPTHLDPHRTALVLVDFQRELFDGRLVVPGAEDAAFAARQLLNWARQHRIGVVHVRNELADPQSAVFRAGSVGAEGIAVLAPTVDERVMIKRTGGAFTQTELDAWLVARNVDTVIVAGLMTHLAVATTASDAATRGYRVVVVSDATATRDLPGVDAATLHTTSLAALADRFADVMTTRRVLGLSLR